MPSWTSPFPLYVQDLWPLPWGERPTLPLSIAFPQGVDSRGRAIDQTDYYQKLGCLSGWWLVHWDTPPVSNGAWLYYSSPTPVPVTQSNRSPRHCSYPLFWDKEEDVSSCQGVKYVPCVKSLAWWVAPLCFSEEFCLGPRHQHQLIWILQQVERRRHKSPFTVRDMSHTRAVSITGRVQHVSWITYCWSFWCSKHII